MNPIKTIDETPEAKASFEALMASQAGSKYTQNKDEVTHESVDAIHKKIVLPELLPSLPCVSPFDYSYLPETLRGYVQDISERMQCPACPPGPATRATAHWIPRSSRGLRR